jgi:DNA-binding LacI/PurR family transcriptional regulator
MYKTIAEELRNEIRLGAYDAGKPLCTERNICQRFNVSRITAKRAVELVEREGLIYRKRGVGSFVREDAAPAVGGAQNIALVAPFRITKGGLFIAVEAAAAELAESGFFFSLHMHKSEEEMLTSMKGMDIAGVLYYPTDTVSESLLDPFAAKGKPVVVLDKPHGMQLANHLLAYGHRNIAYVSRFAETRSSIRERFAGYVDALQGSGLDLMPRFVRLDMRDSDASSHDLLRHVIITLRNEGFTALICENDEVAFYVYQCCLSLGIQIPKEMSIAGFDNIEWSYSRGLMITTIDQNFAEIGHAIAKLLTRPVYRPEHIQIPVFLIPRASSGPCKP